MLERKQTTFVIHLKRQLIISLFISREKLKTSIVICRTIFHKVENKDLKKTTAKGSSEVNWSFFPEN